MGISRFKIIFLFLLITQHSYSINVDSLRSELKNHSNDSIGVQICSDLEFHYEIENFNKAKYYAFKGLAISKKLKYTKGVATSIINCFWLFKNHLKLDSALIFKNQLMQIGIKAKNKDWQGTAFIMEGSICHAKNEFKKALKAYENAFKIYEELNDKLTQSRCYNNTGNIYEDMGESEKAVEAYKKAIDLKKKFNDVEGILGTKVNIAVIYVRKAKYKEAIDLLLEAAIGYDKLNMPFPVARCYVNVAVAYSMINNTNLSLKYLLIAISILEKLDDNSTLALSYNNAGVNYEKLKQYNKAIIYFKKAQKTHEETNNELGVATSLNNIGGIYSKTNETKKALNFFKQALGLKIKNNDINSLPITYFNISSAFINLKNFDSAIVNLNKAETLGLKLKSNADLANIYKGFSEAYELNNDFEKGLTYFKKHKQFADSTLDSDIGKRIVELEAVYQNDKKELDNKRLTIKNQKERIKRLDAENESSKKSRYLLIFIMSSILLFSLVLSYFQNRKRKNEKIYNEKIIAEKEKGLSAVITATEEERKRIAKDLHDGVGQQMTGLKMAWEKLSGEISITSPKEQKNLADLTKILDDTSSEVRNISHQMMPKVLTEMGLIPAIEDMLNKAFKHSLITYEFSPINIKTRFDERIEISLFRVCQELVNNILKHAEATKVLVQIIQQKSALIIILEDNGKGLKSNNSEGIGMLSISSRIDTIHGKINYDPGPQTGTLVTIRIPLN